MKILSIAGRSGAGKSSVAYGLKKAFPETYEVIGVDNYQKYRDDPSFPWSGDLPNYDHPDVIRWNELRTDIQTLKMGREVLTKVWRHPDNPNFLIHKQLLPITLFPKPIIVVEGNLALHSRLTYLYDASIFMYTDADIGNQRRILGRTGTTLVGATNEYMERVLPLMHAEHVEPTRQNATKIIDVTDITVRECISAIDVYARSLLKP